jgi:hypothetical protein
VAAGRVGESGQPLRDPEPFALGQVDPDARV